MGKIFKSSENKRFALMTTMMLAKPATPSPFSAGSPNISDIQNKISEIMGKYEEAKSNKETAQAIKTSYEKMIPKITLSLSPCENQISEEALITFEQYQLKYEEYIKALQELKDATSQNSEISKDLINLKNTLSRGTPDIASDMYSINASIAKVANEFKKAKNDLEIETKQFQQFKVVSPIKMRFAETMTYYCQSLELYEKAKTNPFVMKIAVDSILYWSKSGMEILKDWKNIYTSEKITFVDRKQGELISRQFDTLIMKLFNKQQELIKERANAIRGRK